MVALAVELKEFDEHLSSGGSLLDFEVLKLVPNFWLILLATLATLLDVELLLCGMPSPPPPFAYSTLTMAMPARGGKAWEPMPSTSAESTTLRTPCPTAKALTLSLQYSVSPSSHVCR